MTMYCSKCGYQMEEDARFCSQCGAPATKMHVTYCGRCGERIKDNDCFCEHCGAPVMQKDETVVVAYDYPKIPVLNNQHATQQASNSAQKNHELNMNSTGAAASSPVDKNLPMGWYKFLINFALFAGATINGLLALATFGYASGTWDVVYALGLFGVAAWGIYTRFELAKFKKNGPDYLTVLYIASMATPFIYIVGLASTSYYDPSMGTSLGSSIASSTAMMIVNIVYFKKRRHLFVN